MINISGISLEAKWFGPRHIGGDDALILLHEGLGCIELWKDFPQALSIRSGLPTFCYSRQGYGLSDPVQLPRLESFMHKEGLEVLPEILDATGIENAILVGHSDGGSISIISAGGTRDPRIKAIILLAAHVFVEDLGINSIKKAGIAFENADLREKLTRYHFENVDCAFRGWNDTWLSKEFRDWNIEKYLEYITVPTLVIQGDNDEYGTKAQVKAIKQGIGNNAQVVMMKDCGHSPHLDQKEKTLDILVSFIEKLRSR